MKWRVAVHRDLMTGSLEIYLGYRENGTDYAVTATALETRPRKEGDMIEPLVRIPSYDEEDFLEALVAALKRAQFVPDREKELAAELNAAKGACDMAERFANRALDIIATATPKAGTVHG